MPEFSRHITTKTSETIELTTDEIEAILDAKYSKRGWTVKYDWNVGQWVSLTIVRSKEETSTDLQS
jgi:hypothetical protein